MIHNMRRFRNVRYRIKKDSVVSLIFLISVKRNRVKEIDFEPFVSPNYNIKQNSNNNKRIKF